MDIQQSKKRKIDETPVNFTDENRLKLEIENEKKRINKTFYELIKKEIREHIQIELEKEQGYIALDEKECVALELILDEIAGEGKLFTNMDMEKIKDVLAEHINTRKKKERELFEHYVENAPLQDTNDLFKDICFDFDLFKFETIPMI